jgi:riboflavin kinase/FMN adenylyltransferase
VRVHRRLEDLPSGRRRAVTVGVFDGVHRGHRRILAALLGAARRRHLDATCAITFWPHPMALLRPERAPGLLLTLEERIAALADTGLDELLVLPFDRDVAGTDYTDFARDTLVGAAGMVQLVAGYDFHLGRGRAGSAEAMAALGESLGYRVDVVTPCYVDGRIVSSSRIREDLAAADLAAVADALRRPFPLTGVVEEGSRRGRALGFPTANLAPPPPEKLLPPRGVYLVRARWAGGSADGLLNLGDAPTLRRAFLPEVHLLDGAWDLYGQTLHVDILERLRDEKRFPGPEALKAAIAADVAEARRRLAAARGEGGGSGLRPLE